LGQTDVAAAAQDLIAKTWQITDVQQLNTGQNRRQVLRPLFLIPISVAKDPPMGLVQALGGHPGIDAGGGRGGMAQEVLNHSQILGNLQCFGGEGVAQGVRGEGLLDAGQSGAIVEDLAHSVSGEEQDIIARGPVVAGEERELVEGPSSGPILAGIEIRSCPATCRIG